MPPRRSSAWPSPTVLCRRPRPRHVMSSPSHMTLRRIRSDLAYTALFGRTMTCRLRHRVLPVSVPVWRRNWRRTLIRWSRRLHCNYSNNYSLIIIVTIKVFRQLSSHLPNERVRLCSYVSVYLSVVCLIVYSLDYSTHCEPILMKFFGEVGMA